MDLANFESLYYKTKNGRNPVKEFVDNLSFKAQRRFFVKIDLLEDYGPRLPEPHAKKLENDLYELRFEGDDGIVRIIYFFYIGKTIILLNGFKKKTQKTPRREIELAKNRMADYLGTLSACIVKEG